MWAIVVHVAVLTISEHRAVGLMSFVLSGYTQKSELCELLNQINVLIFNLINISVFGFKI